MVVQAVRTARGVSKRGGLNRDGTQCQQRPWFRKKQCIGTSLVIQLGWGGRLQLGTLKMNTRVVAGHTEHSGFPAIAMALSAMASGGPSITLIAIDGRRIDEGIILGLFGGSPILMPLQVSVGAMEGGIVGQTSGVGSSGPPHHYPCPPYILQQYCTRTRTCANGRDDPVGQSEFKDLLCTVTGATFGV